MYSREFRKYVDLYEFTTFEEAYHQLLNELCDLTADSIRLVIPEKDDIQNLYITGGFSKNELFLHLICEAFTDKKVFTSEISNSSALGAALVISGKQTGLNVELTECMI